MYSKQIAAVVVLGTAAACADKPPPLKFGPGELDHTSLHPVAVHGRVLATGDYLGLPTRIMSVGENLVVLDAAGPKSIHLITAREGRLQRSTGTSGAGPGEFRGASAIARDPKDVNAAWIYDVTLSRMTRVSATAGAGSPTIINLAGKLTPVQPFWINDTLLASPSLSPNGRISFFSARGDYLRSEGVLPEQNGSIPPSVLQQAWMGKMVANPRTGELALATMYADQLEFYSPEGKRLRTVRGPFRFDPKFTVANAQGMAVMGQGDDMRFGYMDVAGTDRFIYALFSGRTREAHRGGASFSRYVHVYDWQGNLKRVLQLDSDVLGMDVSQDGRVLYATRHDPAPAIMVFQLEGR
jgi:hypothetical protein